MIWPTFDQVVNSKTPQKTQSKPLWPSFDEVVKTPIAPRGNPPALNKNGVDVSNHPFNPLNPNNILDEEIPKVNILKETFKPSSLAKSAMKEVNYLYDMTGSILAPGITHEELRDPKILKDTVLGLPKAYGQVTKQIVKNPIDSLLDATSSSAKGISNVITNGIINVFVPKEDREATTAQVEETLNKYLGGIDTKGDKTREAMQEGFHAAGSAAPFVLAGGVFGELGAGAAKITGLVTEKAGRFVGSTAGFVGAGQTQVPLEATVKERSYQLMNDLVGLGLFELGSYAFSAVRGKAETAIRSSLKKEIEVKQKSMAEQTLPPVDPTIESGLGRMSISKEASFTKEGKAVNAEYDAHTISKLADNSILNNPDIKLKKPNRLQGEGISYKEAETGLATNGKNLPNRIVLGKNDAGKVILKDGTHLLEAYREKGIPIPKSKVKLEDGVTLGDRQPPKISGVTARKAASSGIKVYRTELAHKAYKGKAVWGDGQYFSLKKKQAADMTVDPNGEVYEKPNTKSVKTHEIPKGTKLKEFDLDKMSNAQFEKLLKGNKLRDQVLKEGYDGAIIKTGGDLNLGGDQVVIYNKPKQKVPVKVVKNDVSVPREQLPVGTGKEKASRLEARVTESLSKTPQEIKDQLGSTYQQMNKAENIKAASDYVTKFPKEAMDILEGKMEAPKGMLKNSIYVALENSSHGNAPLARKLASLQSTRAGQELSILTEISPESPVKLMKDLIEVRERSVEKRTGKTPKKAVADEVTKIKETVAKKTKSIPKETWSSFIESIKC